MVCLKRKSLLYPFFIKFNKVSEINDEFETRTRVRESFINDVTKSGGMRGHGGLLEPVGGKALIMM